jgi:3-methyladenine DNA glycosylase/8-oxoguanine DNA glycosylase
VDWTAADRALAGADPAMAAVVARHGPCTLARRRIAGGPFGALSRAILYQQLAGSAAAAIHGRFLALFDGRPTPALVAAIPESVLRSAGLSGQKTAYIKDLAAKTLDGTVRLDRLSRLGDDEVVARLTAVHGIGVWTAHMFLIFQLNRPDVWPTGDFGVRAGYGRMHGLAVAPTAGELSSLGEPYRPFRSVAAWYCWRVVDGAAE